MGRKLRQEGKFRRHKRVRAKIFGTNNRPRLSAFRSHKHIYAQIINDEEGKTLVSASDLEIKKIATTKTQKRKETQKKIPNLSVPLQRDSEFQQLQRKVSLAYGVGQLLAKKALRKKIKKVVFDRGGYQYHGRIKALADGARNGGLDF